MLNLRQVEAFRTVCETGTVTGAAQALNVSQPSVTRLISDLEHDVGFKLFARERRGMALTREGALFRKQVERAFFGMRELEQVATGIRDNIRNQLIVGISPSLALEFAPRILAAFQREQPDMHLETRITRSEHILEQVRTNTVSLGILASREEPEDVRTLLYREFRYLALLQKSHPAANRADPIDLDQEEGLDLIAPPPSFLLEHSPTRASAERFAAASVLDAEVHVTAAALARHGMGVALVDPFTEMFFAEDPKLVARPIKNAPIFPFRLVEPMQVQAAPLRDELIERITIALETV